MKGYDVEIDGELADIKISDSVFTKDRVLLIVDENKNRIYIWKGLEANVRKRFIATRHASGLRMDRGMKFKVESIDQDDEPNEFLQLLGKPIKVKTAEGVVTKISAPPEYNNAGPLYKGSDTANEKSSPTAIPRQPPKREVTTTIFPGQQDPDILKKTLTTIRDLQVPPGYHREVILIGRDLYSVIERRRRFFGKDTTEREIEKIRNPPEGVFFATDYTPRVVIDQGDVIAIEFLKGDPGIEGGALIDKGAQTHLSELVGFFQKIGKESESELLTDAELNL